MTLNIFEKLITSFHPTHLFSQKLKKPNFFFKNPPKDHLKLEKTLQDQVDVSLDESTQTCEACTTLKEKKSNY